MAEVHDSLEVPVPLDVSVTGVLLKELHTRPAGTVAASATEPAKFSELVKVTLDVIVKPALPLGEVAETEKSPTWETNVTVWVKPPFAPVIVTRYTPGLMDEGLQVPVIDVVVTFKPAGQLGTSPEGATVVVRVTLPLNPLIGVTVTVELPVAPVLKSAGVVAEIVKSTKLKVAMTE
jgi:hypothetical protein